MIDYNKILQGIDKEKVACESAYGGTLPTIYARAFNRVTENIKECQDRKIRSRNGNRKKG